MLKNSPYVILITILSIISIGCNSENFVTVTGEIHPSSPDTIKTIRQPVHYKYSPKLEKTIVADNQGTFNFKHDADSAEILFLEMSEEAYPLVMVPGNVLHLSIDKNAFPMNVSVDGYPEEWNRRYQEYLTEVSLLDSTLTDDQMEAFRNAEPNRVTEIYRERIDVAEAHLSGTPLDRYYYYNLGEYLNRGFQNIAHHYENGKTLNADSVRQALIQFAKKRDFFTFKSLYSQRAGIRDFAHNYSMSFSIQDSIKNIYGKDLMEYDVKRLGYAQFDQKKREVLQYIEEPEAKAYADMHLVAKRLGEMPLEEVEATYYEYLENYPQYETYTNFLSRFYREMKGVSPGNPAVPFTLPNKNGEQVSMNDFRGKFVLLDFWASWCIPCLDEFPHMRRIYENTSRDKFEIVAISTEEDSLKWIEALDRFENPWVQLYGGNGFQQETFQSYSGGGIPFYILVGPEGKIMRYNDIRASFNLESVLDSLFSVKSEKANINSSAVEL